jgi:NAD(P)-dependent dehydrogenase (short-subunit alcohol dehydrogenase family)
VSVEQWREHLEANLLGAVAVTRALFEHVRTAGGRFVFVGSQAGRIALPGSSTYSAGKHDLEALTEALHHELAATPMRVALIEPGQIDTPLFEKAGGDLARCSAACRRRRSLAGPVTRPHGRRRGPGLRLGGRRMASPSAATERAAGPSQRALRRTHLPSRLHARSGFGRYRFEVENSHEAGRGPDPLLL